MVVLEPGARIAVIGGGVSGIAAAGVLRKAGFAPVIFDRQPRAGGVWAVSYPGVHLQNTWPQYHLADFDWPFEPDLHPSGEQILDYLEQAAAHLGLDLRLGHEVIELAEEADGWRVRCRHGDEVREESFAYAVIATGQYTEGKDDTRFPGHENFRGRIVTERDIRSLDVFDSRRVAVVGFGKSALDMATLAASRGAEVHHVFRTARWTIPFDILGIHYDRIMFSRFGSVMMPCWAHPTRVERFLHRRAAWLVDAFWNLVAAVFRWQIERLGRKADAAARQRLRLVVPGHDIRRDLRSASALAPASYYAAVRDGVIQPHRSEVGGFTPGGLRLQDGTEVPCDLAVLSLGSKTPTYPFLPDRYRELLEGETDGPQLYRHLVHPRMPRLGFAGFNHGFMHYPAVEIGTLWLCACLRGEMVLPPAAEMEACIRHVTAWKREHIQFEPSRSLATSTRFQQYLDILLKDLGMSPYRKMPNVIAEVFGRYGAADYAGVVEDYLARGDRPIEPLAPLPQCT